MLMIDITNIQFKESIFDYVLCSHVLEHIPDDIQAMKEVLRILKPEGMAVFQVPVLREKTFEDPSITNPHERLKLFGQTDHVRIYGKDIKDRLIKAGFIVDIVRYGENLGENAVVRYGLDPTEELYICKKKQ